MQNLDELQTGVIIGILKNHACYDQGNESGDFSRELEEYIGAKRKLCYRSTLYMDRN